jgi:hypothetical protein
VGVVGGGVAGGEEVVGAGVVGVEVVGGGVTHCVHAAQLSQSHFCVHPFASPAHHDLHAGKVEAGASVGGGVVGGEVVVPPPQSQHAWLAVSGFAKPFPC